MASRSPEDAFRACDAETIAAAGRAARRRPRRDADRDRLWARGRRDLGHGGRRASSRPRDGRRSIRSSPMSSMSRRRDSRASSRPRPKSWREAFWPGPLTLVLPAAPGCRVSLLARAGLDTLALRAPAHDVARALIEAAGDAACGALRQPLRPRQPDDGRSCARRPRRPDRLDPRRRPVAARARIDDRRLSRRRRRPAASWRDRARGDRGGARHAARTRGRLRERRRRARAASNRTTRRAPASGSTPRDAGTTRPRSILPARSRASAPVARLDLSPSGGPRRGGGEALRLFARTGCIRSAAASPSRTFRIGGLARRSTTGSKRAAAAREA